MRSEHYDKLHRRERILAAKLLLMMRRDIGCYSDIPRRKSRCIAVDTFPPLLQITFGGEGGVVFLF